MDSFVMSPFSTHHIRAQTFYNLTVIEMPLSFIHFVFNFFLCRPLVETVLTLFIPVWCIECLVLCTSLLAIYEFFINAFAN